MRIISGTARGRRLSTFSGTGIRPTPDRVREALFSSLFSKLGNFHGLKVLELFAGSGAMSLEALSRGAESAVLVDSGSQAAKLIDENIRICRFEGRARLQRQEVLSALPGLSSEAPFDLIFMDPPYRKDLAPQVLIKIDALQLLAEDGIICAETAGDEVVENHYGSLQQLETRRYGSTSLHLYGTSLSED